MGYGDPVVPPVEVAAPPVTPYLSHTRISTYADCGMKVKLQYVDEAPREPQGALIGGIAVHDTLDRLEKDALMLDEETFLPGGRADEVYAEALLRILDEEAGGDPSLVRWGGPKSKAFPTGHDFEWWRLFGPGMVRRGHLVRLADEQTGFTVLDSELEVSAFLPSGTRFTARIDQLLEHEERFYIRDWKTGRYTRPSSRLQVVLYAYAVHQTISIPVVGGQIVYLGQAVTKIDTAPADELLPVALQWIAEVERGLDAGVYVMNPGSYCSSCSVRAACPWGSTLEEASSADS